MTLCECKEFVHCSTAWLEPRTLTCTFPRRPKMCDSSIIGRQSLVPLSLKVLHALLNNIFSRGQYYSELAQKTLGFGWLYDWALDDGPFRLGALKPHSLHLGSPFRVKFISHSSCQVISSILEGFLGFPCAINPKQWSFDSSFLLFTRVHMA